MESSELKTSASNSKTVSFHTLGCRLNFAESGSIAQGFKDRGYSIVEFGEAADVVFLNTCTVTDSADSTCRNLIRKAQKASPEAKIVVAGCYAQMEAEKIKSMQGVDLILGTSEKYRVFEYLDETENDEDSMVKIDKSLDFFGASTTLADSHTRAFLKIQDGCNYICSFCIIPFARGRSRAISIQEALKNAHELVEHGFKEIVLTGVNIGEYEQNSGEKLVDLLRALADIEKLKRIRLSSVEPNTLTEEIVALMASNSKFLDHFHIPLQSGDDTVLKNMRRKYTVADYRRIVEMIKKYFPNASIGADVIAGFPGETEEQFQNTFNLMRELPITHFHVFPFSRRKGTTAASLPNQIQHQVKKSRVKSLIMLGEAKLRNSAEEMIGKMDEVLFETKNESGFYVGHTRNFLKVEVASAIDLKNKIVPVKILGINDSGLLQGQIVH